MGANEQVVHVNCVFVRSFRDISELRFQNWIPSLFQHVDSGGDQEAENLTSVGTTHGGLVRPTDCYRQ